jgi:nucleoside-diphosphate-sugar epimerase
MRVLVTGANGFIGQHVVGELRARGADVIAVSRQGGVSVPGVDSIAADLLTPAGIGEIGKIRADILVHSAWETRHGYFWNAPENALWQEATLALAQAFLEAGGKRIVALGTCMEYALAGDGPLDEATTPLQPTFPYAIAKDATRQALELLCEAHGASLVWARVFHLYGPREHAARLVPSVVRALLSGEEARTSPGTQLRDFMSSLDCGTAIAHLALSEAEGPFNIGSGEAITIAALVSEIADMLGARHLLRIGALPLRPDDPPVIVPSVKRLEAKGFRPKCSRAERLAEAIEFWKAR